MNTLILFLVPWVWPVAATALWSDSTPPPDHVELRLATSEDGLEFTDTGRLFAARGEAPCLVRLENNRLLALFDHVIKQGDRQAGTTLVATLSPDEGHTWSAARLVRLIGPGDTLLPARHATAVELPKGYRRIYFTTAASVPRADTSNREEPATIVRGALTQDGATFRLDRRTALPIRGADNLHVTALIQGEEFQLYADDLPAAGVESREDSEPRLFFSRTGRRFGARDVPRMPRVEFVGSVIEVPGGLRAYVSQVDDDRRVIRSLVSKDGTKWQCEPGFRITSGWDPAVAKLRDGTFLMVYCAKVGSHAYSGDSVAGGIHGGDGGKGAGQPPLVAALDEAEVTLAQAMFPDGGRPDAAWAEWAEAEMAEATADGSPGSESAEGEDALAAAAEQAAAGMEHAADAHGTVPPSRENGLVSRPDFVHRFDYLAWWHQALVAPDGPGNAYRLYREFLNTPADARNGVDKLPQSMSNMFSDDDYVGRPRAWNAADHPDWVASGLEWGPYMSQFNVAARQPYYSYPLPDEFEEMFESDDERLLLGIVLPNLSGFRALTKATLADAWRTDEDGKVSPTRMIDAWETVMGNASHLNEGSTLIEELVSAAERHMVHESARWALYDGVFDPDELADAFEALRQSDPGNPDPLRAVRGEHAMCMDTMQWAFWPEDGSDTPRLNRKRLQQVLDFWDGKLDEMEKLTADDAYEAMEAFDSYYTKLGDLMSVGYPRYRGKDLTELQARYRDTNQLTEMLMPNLARVHQLRNRVEASRRATQLAYATHLYKQEHGSWPESLDALAADYGYDITTDPFTGDYFGYRVTDDGPTIYSLSENGIDDGGIHTRHWGEDEGEENGDDHVFWPPHDRR